MKLLVAVAEAGRATVGMEVVRVPRDADLMHMACPGLTAGKHTTACRCRHRWVSLETGSGVPSTRTWLHARVANAPDCFTPKPGCDRPEYRRMVEIADDLAVGTIVTVGWAPDRIPTDSEPALAYYGRVVGPH